METVTVSWILVPEIMHESVNNFSSISISSSMV